MKKFSMAVGAAIALAGVTAPAQAQLVLGGINACFGGASNTSVSNYQSNGNSANACANNSSTTMWSMPGSLSTSDDRFQFQRATPDAPGGSTLTPTFGADNKSNVFNLGWFTFDDRSNNAYSNTSSTLNFKLFFGSQTSTADVVYNNLTVNYFLGTGYNGVEKYNFSGGGWSDWFTVNSEEYRFAVVGYDTPHPGVPANYCKDYDAIPTPMVDGAPKRYSEASNGKICGQFEKKASPNIQTTVPEPSTYALMGAGLMGIFGFARRRNRNA